MNSDTITASARGMEGKALTNAAGKVITRTMQVPESKEEIALAFGSLLECVKLALRAKKIDLQNEIRLEAQGAKQGKANGNRLNPDAF